MSGRAEGFTYERRKGGDVVIAHQGRIATVLRGDRAAKFFADLRQGEDPQLLMARLTGNYKRGNERQGKQSPRT